MNNIIKFIGSVALGMAAFISCDKNEVARFDDADAFAAFDKTEINVSEDATEPIRIPVTLASVQGLSESIKFEVVTPEGKGAVEGTNFEVLTSSGVLSFDSQNRTQYIEVLPKLDGVYTGDLKFQLVLSPSATVGTGSSDVCTITINDVDHPLSAILGNYTFTGAKFNAAATSWTVTFLKDADDDHKVWFYNLFGVSGWAGNDTVYYGNVNDDLTSINIPFGQESEYTYSNGNPVLLLGLDADGNGYETGSMDVKIVNEGGQVSLVFPDEWGLFFYINDAGTLSYSAPGTLSAVKQ